MLKWQNRILDTDLLTDWVCKSRGRTRNRYILLLYSFRAADIVVTKEDKNTYRYFC